MISKPEFFTKIGTEACLRQVQKLDQEVFGNSAWSFENWNSEFKTANILLIFNDQESPVGYLTFSLTDDEAEIRRLGIAVSYRRYGAATLLLKRLLAYCFDQKASRVYLDVSSDNDPAIMLYRRVGFVENGRRKRYYANGSDALLMVHYISSAALPPPPSK